MIPFLIICALIAFVLSRFTSLSPIKMGLLAGAITFAALALVIAIGAP